MKNYGQARIKEARVNHQSCPIPIRFPSISKLFTDHHSTSPPRISFPRGLRSLTSGELSIWPNFSVWNSVNFPCQIECFFHLCKDLRTCNHVIAQLRSQLKCKWNCFCKWSTSKGPPFEFKPVKLGMLSEWKASLISGFEDGKTTSRD